MGVIALLACSTKASRGGAADGAVAVPDATITDWDAAAGDASAADEPPPATPDAAQPDPAPDASATEARMLPDGPSSCSQLCNAVTPSYPAVTADRGQGNITAYTTQASSGGACNYGATGVMYFVAVNVNVVPGDGLGQWQNGRICGQCVEVTALTSDGPKSVVVRIMDKCADGYCGMDLGGAAPAAIMGDSIGRYDGSWRMVPCTGHPEVSDGPPNLSVSTGANAYWSRVQIRNPPGAITEITWRDSQGGTGTFPYANDPENTFEVPAPVLKSSAATITVTGRFTDGSSLSVDVRPEQLATENTNYVMH